MQKGQDAAKPDSILQIVPRSGLETEVRGIAMSRSSFIRGILAGMLGGLAGNLSQFLFGACIFILLGWPVSTPFTIIGDAAAAFFSRFGNPLAGGAPLGMGVYFLIGLSEGAVLGAAFAWKKSLQKLSLRQQVILSIIYVELLSLPLMAAGIYALNMRAADAALWFSISFFMHLVYGFVLGIVISYGLGSSARSRPE